MPTSSPSSRIAEGRAYLLSAARAGELPTYREFADAVGGMQNGNGPLLEKIAAQCREGAEPDVTVLVVRKGSGTPARFQGREFEPSDQDAIAAWHEEVRRVRARPWHD